MDAFTGMATTYDNLKLILTASVNNFNFFYSGIKAINLLKNLVKANTELSGMFITLFLFSVLLFIYYCCCSSWYCNEFRVTKNAYWGWLIGPYCSLHQLGYLQGTNNDNNKINIVLFTLFVFLIDYDRDVIWKQLEPKTRPSTPNNTVTSSLPNSLVYTAYDLFSSLLSSLFSISRFSRFSRICSLAYS